METYSMLKHFHTLLVTLFTISIIIKTILLIANKHAALDKYRSKTMLTEIIISVLFLGMGIAMMVDRNFYMVFGWQWMKLILVLLVIPMGIIAFKKHNKFIAVLISLLLLFMIVNSFVRFI